MKNIKTILIILGTLFATIANSQTQTFYYVTNTNDWLAFNGPSRLAGNGWNTISYSTQNWVTPFNGNGSSNGQCPAPYSVPANQFDNQLGIPLPVIWSRQFANVRDTACFRRIINIPSCSRIVQATVSFASDDNATFYINGVLTGSSINSTLSTYNFNSQQACTVFNSGDNVFAAEARDAGGSCMSFVCGIKLVIDTAGLTTSISDFTNSSSQNVSAYLEQNYPNPLCDQTEILYQLSLDFENAEIILMDITGKILNSFNINKKGSGKIFVNSNDLQSGVYLYSLLVDGKKSRYKTNAGFKAIVNNLLLNFLSGYFILFL